MLGKAKNFYICLPKSKVNRFFSHNTLFNKIIYKTTNTQSWTHQKLV